MKKHTLFLSVLIAFSPFPERKASVNYPIKQELTHEQRLENTINYFYGQDINEIFYTMNLKDPNSAYNLIVKLKSEYKDKKLSKRDLEDIFISLEKTQQ